MGVKLTLDGSATITRLLDNYLTRWGPVFWRHLTDLSVPSDATLGLMFKALSEIESDSVCVRRKLSATGADFTAELREFIIIWLAEEAEHGRAIDTVARKYGVTVLPTATKRSNHRSIRTFFTWPALYGARALPGVCAAYTALGAMQELVALKTYKKIAELTPAPVSDLLRDIARQEARHIKFYRGCAEVFLSESRKAQITTRRLLSRLWQPPGTDLLGRGNYEEIFAPVLTQADFQKELLKVDSMLDRLPGLAEMSIMERYLRRNKFDIIFTQ